MWLAFFGIVHIAAAQFPTQGSQFFRVVGPTAVKITGFNPDGTIVWSNAIAGTNYTVQITSSTLAGDTNWVNYIQIAATNCINTNFIFNFNSTNFPPFPTNFPTFPTNFPTFPTFPTNFPTFPTFPTNFPPITFPTNFPPPPTNPPDPGTNGTNSIVQQLAPGDDNDGNYDINEFDYHITALILSDVLAADPNGPASILADGTKPATFFEPDDAQWVRLARKLTGQALPLPSAATEQATYEILKALGTDRLEKILTYHIIPGITLTPLAPATATTSASSYTTANGESLLIKGNFGIATLVDNNPLTSDSGVVEGAMNKGNKQIAWSSAVLLPSTY
jgi:hypothetical protein